MRTTGMYIKKVFSWMTLCDSEGVWLSVTPTDDALIVALDFEGWNSDWLFRNVFSYVSRRAQY